MRDTVFVLLFGAFMWAAVVVGFVSLYVYAGDSVLCGALNDRDACVRLEWRHGSRANSEGAWGKTVLEFAEEALATRWIERVARA
jgi:hypothetical protein